MNLDDKPSGPSVLFSVAMTLVATYFAWTFLFDNLKIDYLSTHQVPDVIEKGFFFSDSTRPANKYDISTEILGWPNIILKSALPAIIFAVIYPYVGRLIASILLFLANQIDRIYGFRDGIGAWPIEVSLMVGTLWPMTFFLIPLMLIAIIIGSVYRSLWS
jgi:hypothetical protein